MPDLLHRLAARTLGSASTLTPRLPTYYEPRPSTVDADVTAAAPSTVEAGVPARETSQRAGAGTPERFGKERTVAVGRAAESVTPRPVTRVDAGSPGRPDAVAPAPPPPTAPMAAPTLTPRVEVAGVAATPLPPLPEPAPAPALTRRAALPSQARPDVHITIGRIEVRAEPPAQPAAPAPRPVPPAAPREPAGQPALSLAAYLRGDDGRPR